MLSKKLLESLPRSFRGMKRQTILILEGVLTFQQCRALYYVKEGMGQSQMAESLTVSAAAISKIIHQLTEKGLVEITLEKDRRAHKLSLTKEGKRCLDNVSKQMEKSFDRLINSLTSQEKKDLQRGLDVLEKLMK